MFSWWFQPNVIAISGHYCIKQIMLAHWHLSMFLCHITCTRLNIMMSSWYNTHTQTECVCLSVLYLFHAKLLTKSFYYVCLGWWPCIDLVGSIPNVEPNCDNEIYFLCKENLSSYTNTAIICAIFTAGTRIKTPFIRTNRHQSLPKQCPLNELWHQWRRAVGGTLSQCWWWIRTVSAAITRSVIICLFYRKCCCVVVYFTYLWDLEMGLIPLFMYWFSHS